MKRPHTNKVISSCYRSFIKNQNFSSNSSLEEGLLLETVVHTSESSTSRKSKMKVYATASCFFSGAHGKLNQWVALRSKQASYGTPTAAATPEMLQAGNNCGKVHLVEAEISFLCSKGRIKTPVSCHF